MNGADGVRVGSVEPFPGGKKGAFVGCAAGKEGADEKGELNREDEPMVAGVVVARGGGTAWGDAGGL
jgi:hypothetical protein